MDVVCLGIVAICFALTAGLIWLAERLGGGAA